MPQRTLPHRPSPRPPIELLEQRIAPATLHVTNLQDAGKGSLRYELALSADGDVIDFDPSLHGDLSLASSLVVTTGVQILGPGAAVVSIHGDGADPVFVINPGATIPATSYVIVAGLSITGGGGDHGGGIDAESVNLGLSHLDISGNVAALGGAGVYYHEAPGGAATHKLVVDGSAIHDNGGSSTATGGGILLDAPAGDTLTIQNSTISGNQVSGTGGGVELDHGTLTVQNSTIAGNAAGVAEGGGGLYIAAGQVTLHSTIVAGNTASGAAHDIGLGVNASLTADHSLIQVPPTALATDTPDTNIYHIDPKLSPLADNGGKVKTMALASDSAALSAGSNPAGLAKDGRGDSFTRSTSDGLTDIGAYQHSSGAVLAHSALSAAPANTDNDLSISVTSDVQVAPHGGLIHYTITYSFVGAVDSGGPILESDDTTLTELLPPHTTFDAADSTPGFTEGTPSQNMDPYTLHTGTLKAVKSNTATFTVRVDPDVPTTVTHVSNAVSLTDGVSTPTASVDTFVYQGILADTPGVSAPGHYAPPIVQVQDISTGAMTSFQPYPKTVRDSIRVAVGDMNGDGFDDIIVSTEHGTAPVKIFDESGNLLATGLATGLQNLMPFGAHAGAFVASGHLGVTSLKPTLAAAIPSQSETPDDLVFGSSLGGGALKIYSGQTGAPVGKTFYPFGPSFHGGVRVAIGDVNGDGVDDLIVAEGFGGSLVKVYSGGNTAAPLAAFQVARGYTGGINLAVGDLDHDGSAEIVTGRNALSAPIVDVFHYEKAGPPLKIASFTAFDHVGLGGVRVAVTDYNHDGYLDIVASAGYDEGSQVRIFDASSLAPQVNVNTTKSARLLPLALTATSSPVSAPSFPVLTTFVAFPGFLKEAVWVAATAPVNFVTQN